jgi:hypothetical protein
MKTILKFSITSFVVLFLAGMFAMVVDAFRWPKANKVIVENAACYVGTEEYDLREYSR